MDMSPNSQNGNCPDISLAITGAGFAGIAMAIRFQASGRPDFLIFERASEIGGTWRDNIYPGCGCDIPSHLYSYSFRLNPDWSRMFSSQPEILAYMKDCVRAYRIQEKIVFDTSISRYEFKESEGKWYLYAGNRLVCKARAVVSATGPLNRPNIPAFAGKESFAGPAFHSSEWDTSVDLAGKRVAVIGTGASAIQLVPEIAEEVSQLYVLQRTAPWVLPKPDRTISNLEKKWFRRIPFLQRLVRNFLYWKFEVQFLGFKGNNQINKIATQRGLRHIRKSISDPVLRKQVTPDFQIGCKRVLLSNNYYPALEASNVELVTDPLAKIEASAISLASSRKLDIDVIIYATGFHASEVFFDVEVEGLNGKSLQDRWATDGPEAYYGISVAGFPNLFFLTGPNTGLGHNSVIVMIEAQINYVLDCLEHLEGNPYSYLDLKEEIQDSYNKDIQAKLADRVWASGCQSWYQTSSGKNTTLWPGFTVSYRKQTRKANLSAYRMGSVKSNRKKQIEKQN